MISSDSSILRRRRRLSRRARSRSLFLEPLEPRLLLTAELVSVTPSLDAPAAGSDYSTDPAISARGKYIVFASHADDLDDDVPDTNGTQDVFVRDMDTGATTLLSVNFDGTASTACPGSFCDATRPAGSHTPAISDDGRFVAFVSRGTDLVEEAIDVTPNYYVHDRDVDENGIYDEPGARLTRLLSIAADGSAAGAGVSFASRPVISGNGRFVAFISGADDIAIDNGVLSDGSGDSSIDISGANVYLAEVSAGVQLVNVNAEGTGSGSGGVANLSISEAGDVVAFDTSKADLTSAATGGVDDTNFTLDVFVGGDVPVELVSVNRDGDATANGASFEPVVSRDGGHVVFISGATDLVEGTDTNEAADVFVRDLAADVTTLVSRSRSGAPVLGPGEFAAGDGASPPGVGADDDTVFGPAISDDGRFIVFQSVASDLLDPALGVLDTNERSDLFRFDRDPDEDGFFDPEVTETVLVTLNREGTASASFDGVPVGIAGSFRPAMSGDGRFVAFASTGTDLVSGVVSGVNVYLRDMLTGLSELVSETTSGVEGGGGGSDGLLSPVTTRVVAISRDGSRVAFSSRTDASDLDPTVVADPPNPSTVGEFDVFTGTPPTDIRVLGSRAGGLDSGLVAYSIDFEAVDPPLDIGIFRSTDETLDVDDVLLDTFTITTPDELDVGSRFSRYTIGTLPEEVVLPGIDASSPATAENDDDYFVLFVADPADVVAELDVDPIGEDNTGSLVGVYYAADGVPSPVFVHGRLRERGRDTITVTADEGLLTVSPGFAVRGTRTYRLDEVTSLRIRTHGGDDEVTSGPLDDLVQGGAGDDVLRGGGGNDVLGGGDGSDFLSGEDGDDILDGGPGSDILEGGAGDDILDGGPDRDVLIGGPGDDTFVVTPGDEVDAGPDEDIVVILPPAGGPEGEDPPSPSLVFKLTDGGGMDTIDLSQSAPAFRLDLDSRARQAFDGQNLLQLVGIWENVRGSRFGDVVYARALAGSARSLLGGEGNDTLVFDAEGLPVTARYVGDALVIEVAGREPVTIEGFEEVRTINGTEHIIDNSDPAPAFSTTGTWNENTNGQGLNGTFLFGPSGSATWTFDGLPPGNYQVAATAEGGAGGATNSKFTIGGGGTPVEVRLDQSRAGGEFDSLGRSWSNLAAIEVTGTSLTVEVDAAESERQSIADAIYVKPVDVSDVINVMDEADPRASGVGGVRQRDGAFRGSQRLEIVDDELTYSFEGLRPNARYDVFGTWPVDAGNATNAAFSIVAGGLSFAGQFDQTQAPNDRREFELFWDLLATITADNDGSVTAQWKRDSSADGNVIADMVLMRATTDTEAFSTPDSTFLDQDGEAAGKIPVTVINTGELPVILRGVTVTGAEFSLGSVPVATNLPPGASTTFTVDFSANSLGDFSGTASIDTNVIGKQPLNIPLNVTVFEDEEPPILSFNIDSTISAGAVAEFDGTISDNGEPDLLTFDISAASTVEDNVATIVGVMVRDDGTYVFEGQLTTSVVVPDDGLKVDLIATVEDTAGNVGTNTVTVNVVPNQPPVINSFAPPHGSIVQAGEKVVMPFDVLANLRILPGGVQFLVDGQTIPLGDDELICPDSDTGLNCIAQIPIPKEGPTFTYQLRATDTGGNVTLTEPVTYFVAGSICLEEGEPTSTISTDGSDIVVVRADGSEAARRRLAVQNPLEIFGTPSIDNVVFDFSLPRDGLKMDLDEGDDRLTLGGDGIALDLTLPEVEITNLELIGIESNGPSRLMLDAEEVLSISGNTGTLVVESRVADTIVIGSGWSLDGTQIVDGTFFRILEQIVPGKGLARLLLNGPRNLQNPVNNLDVDNDGFVAPVDVLVTITEQQDRRFSDGTGRAFKPASLALDTDPTNDFDAVYRDVNGDGFFVPLDTLLIINFLNAPTGNPEAESIVVKTLALKDGETVSAVQGSRPTSSHDWLEFASSDDQVWQTLTLADTTNEAAARRAFSAVVDELMKDDELVDLGLDLPL